VSQSASVAQDSNELEALFDSVARSDRRAAPSAAVAAREASAQSPGDLRAEKMLTRIGQLTRTLHDSLRELGYDKDIERAASAIPDARDRLAYVASMTEQAAQRTLNAIEIAKPIQERLADEATGLVRRWDSVFARELALEEFPDLVAATRRYLAAVPGQAGATNAHLLEIMMAQDFQDLTGQVIKKIADIIQSLEAQLLALLLENISPERCAETGQGLMNGPVVNAAGRSDVVTSQQQVDDLLGSLGF